MVGPTIPSTYYIDMAKRILCYGINKHLFGDMVQRSNSEMITDKWLNIKTVLPIFVLLLLYGPFQQ